MSATLLPRLSVRAPGEAQPGLRYFAACLPVTPAFRLRS